MLSNTDSATTAKIVIEKNDYICFISAVTELQWLLNQRRGYVFMTLESKSIKVEPRLDMIQSLLSR